MKKTLVLVTLLIAFIIYNNGISQDLTNYFNPSGKTYILSVPLGNCASGTANFDFSEISTNRLDVSTTVHLQPFQISLGYYQELSYWNQNNGSGNFGNSNQFYSTNIVYDLNETQKIVGPVFMKLRDNSDKKDAVLVSRTGIRVHQNINNAISSTLFEGISASGSSFGNSYDAGCFDLWDTREDLIVSNGSNSFIYRNLGNGNLDPNYYPFSFSGTKVKLKQLTDKNDRLAQYYPLDRDEIIVYSGSTITVYRNNNSNGFDASPYYSVNVGYTISDIDVSDVNGDGYSDILVCGGSYPNYKAQAYMNGHGGFINPFPSWDVTSSSLGSQCLIATADLDKDGGNEIILMGYEGVTNVYLSKYLFNTPQTPTQTFTASYSGHSIKNIKAVDLYNTGGISLVASSSYTDVYNNGTYNIFVIPPVTADPAPAPPQITAGLYPDGSVYRPKINIYKKGDRDFNHFQIWKYKNGWSGYVKIADNYTSDYYIDYSEYIYGGGDEDNTYHNCFYYVNSVDNSNYASINSNQLGYSVGIPSCIGCQEDGNGDNPGKGKNTAILPQNYSVTNFPNPFNPVTKIVYALPKAGNVNITVYNSLGQIVKALLNEYKTAGSYLVEFNGSNLSSGMYFYKITSQNYSEVKKMMLIK
ncbi:MAG: T9SS type A sorting domain-containing protein [Ignavibacteriae bacterium]|nr:T9SS type A sorting domain-containing protein [Ignavibacteriota bacterium]